MSAEPRKLQHQVKLQRIPPAEERDILKQWRRIEDGMDGPRGGVPATPDDPVANLLLEAAGQAIGHGQVQKGVNILKLVVRDYRESQEAALARSALDQLAKEHSR